MTLLTWHRNCKQGGALLMTLLTLQQSWPLTLTRECHSHVEPPTPHGKTSCLSYMR